MDKHLRVLLNDIKNGHRPTEEEALELFRVQGHDVWDIAAAADSKRQKTVGDAVTYVRTSTSPTSVSIVAGSAVSQKNPGMQAYISTKKRRFRKEPGSQNPVMSRRSAR
jgi:Cu2+-containing amine oxidase